ncbi:hypothetical protein LAT59_03470 [Candidatus Gracilibacteria bacterium]|nr:hypothetical protein [Candidatus Gracilibacteria bacterium]
MEKIFQKALAAHTAMLLLHIDSKTLDHDFHHATEEFYEGLFDTAHEIGEKYVDLGSHHESSDIIVKKQQAFDIIKNLREEIETYARNNTISLGTEDLLGSLVNKLEDMEGTAKSFI